MKKVYVQPELELLKVSASNEFLIGSPNEDESLGYTDATDGWEDNQDWGSGSNDFENWN